jgi:hypothetical protein
MKRSKFSVEDCARLNVTRDLFSTGRVKFDGRSSGTWNGVTWRTLVSDQGSFRTRWELVPHVSSSEIEGARWYLRDQTGKRVASLFVTPDGDVGSRLELRLRYSSQRLWMDKKKRAWKRLKVVTGIDGPTDA